MKVEYLDEVQNKVCDLLELKVIVIVVALVSSELQAVSLELFSCRGCGFISRTWYFSDMYVYILGTTILNH